MQYRLEVRNKYNYGYSNFKCNSLSEVKKILSDYLFDGDIKLYEVKEISLPCDYKYVENESILNDYGAHTLWNHACVHKKYIKTFGGNE